MNNPRREKLRVITEQLEEMKSSLENILSDEEEYRDNMPENLQGSERFEKAEGAISNIEDAISDLEDVISSLESAVE